MYRDKKILAVIPARAGSKGLPGKNIKTLNGKPLISWTIEQAKNSSIIDRAIVSSDSKSIIDVALSCGADVPFIRPSSISGDTAPMFDVLKHALDSLEEDYDVIVLLEPTSPLRKDSDIDNALVQLIDQYDEYDSTVSLGKIQLEHPGICKKISSNSVVSYQDSPKHVTYRQQLDPAYFPYGVIYASKVESLISSKSFYQDRTLPFIIERWQNYEIDDELDFMCVKYIMASRLKKHHTSLADLDMRDMHTNHRLNRARG